MYGTKNGRATIRPPPVSDESRVVDTVTEAFNPRASARVRDGHAPGERSTSSLRSRWLKPAEQCRKLWCKLAPCYSQAPVFINASHWYWVHRCAVLCDVPFSSSDALPSLLRLDSDERLLCLIGFVHNSLFKVINMVTGTTNCVFHRMTIKNGQIKLRYTTSQRLDHTNLACESVWSRCKKKMLQQTALQMLVPAAREIISNLSVGIFWKK